jgi:hypothetical protein
VDIAAVCDNRTGLTVELDLFCSSNLSSTFRQRAGVRYRKRHVFQQKLHQWNLIIKDCALVTNVDKMGTFWIPRNITRVVNSLM